MRTATSDFALTVTPAGGAQLAVHYAEGPLRPFVLVHGPARVGWDDVAFRLNQVGHAVATIDLPARTDLFSTDLDRSGDEVADLDSTADEVADLIEALDLRGSRQPVVAGVREGGIVALSLAARRGGVRAVGCVDGGWARPVGGSGGDPRAWLPLIAVPVLLCAAPPPDDEATTRAELARVLARLPHRRVQVSWYPFRAAGQVLSAEPGRLTQDLLRLAECAEPGPDDPPPRLPMPGRAPGYLPLLEVPG